MSDSRQKLPHAESCLSVRQLSFSYSAECVLKDISLGVDSGSTLAIMGKSGSGKSTLLQLLAGLLSPAAGEVQFQGSPFSRLSDRRRAAVRLRHFGFVFQFGELLPELTLQENVELPLLFLGTSRAESRRRAAAALERVGVGQEMHRFQSQVSGGQQQRAALARAIVHEPRVIFADEPTGSLDETTASSVLDLLFASSRSGSSAVIVVTHSQDVADRCDHVSVLREGQLEEMR